MFDEIINYIARTNLFNFIIFFSIIVFLVRKIQVGEKLEAAKTSVADSIEESKIAKAESETKLNTIKNSMSHLEEEIDLILKKSEETAKLVGEKILEDAEKSVLAIHENTEKALENSRQILKNELLRRASLASIEAAKSHILEELNKNPDLHNKLIDESINSVEGVQL